MLDRIQQIIDVLDDVSPLSLGAEIGVFEAHLSKGLLDTFPHLDMILVDSWRPFDGGDWTGQQSSEFFEDVFRKAMCRMEPVKNRCRIITEPSPECSNLVIDDSLDFIFIDANHKYESVQEDIIAWWPKLRTGGLLSGHDYVESDDPLGPGGRGVKKAVLEFADLYGLETYTGLDTTWWIWKQE